MDKDEEKTVLINNVIYKKDDPKIVLDYFTDKYILLSDAEKISVGIELTRKFIRPRKKFTITDSSTWNIYNVINKFTHHANSNIPQPVKLCLRSIIHSNIINIYLKEPLEQFIKTHDLVKGINNDEVYYDKREIAIMDTPKPYRKFDNTYKKKLVNDLLTVEKDNSNEILELKKNINKRNIQMGVDSLTHQILEGKKYTFGIEIETSLGRLEEDDVKDLNVKAVHDGSLRGPNGEDPLGGEYVTGVLVGDSGIAQIYEICRILNSKCKIDHRCGIHVHLGNLNWNKEDVVFSYILAEILENEIFSILPKSRRNNSYCRKLTPLLKNQLEYLKSSPSITDYEYKIDSFYDIIYTEVSGINDGNGRASKSINKREQHPKGPKCGFDKKSQRYCWLNYVTLLFNTKQIPDSHTLEFRPMSATLNFKKIRNWLKICVAFVYFVENFKNIIKQGYYKDKVGNTFNLDLELVVKLSYPKSGNNLIDYIRERKETFKLHDESFDYIDKEKPTKKTIKEVTCAL